MKRLPQLSVQWLSMCVLAIHLVATPVTAEDTLESIEIKRAGASMFLSVAPGELSLDTNQLTQWIGDSAEDVAKFYGQFPIDRLMILVQPVKGTEVMSGTAYGGEVPYLVVRVGHAAVPSSLERDWILVHEMVHLAMPQLRRPHHWLEEGIATYIEPILRYQAGKVDQYYVWKWLYEGLPNALPPHNIEGLDHNMTWENLYWGGTLFCFIADLQIREATKGDKGLWDGLVAIIKSGGSIRYDWPLERVLSSIDQAVGHPIVTRLYQSMAKQVSDVDLMNTWQELGVSLQDGKIRLNESAKRAWLRQALLTYPLSAKKERLR